MKTFFVSAVSVLAMLVTSPNLNHVHAVDIMSYTEFDQAYPGGYTEKNTLRVWSFGGLWNASWGNTSIQTTEPLKITIDGGAIEVVPSFRFELPTDTEWLLVGRIFDGSQATWDGDAIYPGEIGVAPSSFVGVIELILDPGVFVLDVARLNSIPEPGHFALAGLGCIGLFLVRRRWRR